MASMRSHEFPDGRKWHTFSDGPMQSYICVPVNQIEGLSNAQIGQRVKALIEQAKVTELINWIGMGWTIWLGRREASNEREYRSLCIALGSDAEGYHRDRVPMEIARFDELEQLKHLDTDLEEAYSAMCEFMDATLSYLRTKKTKITPAQRAARKLLLQLRHGCELCGLVDGKHTAQCRALHERLNV